MGNVFNLQREILTDVSSAGTLFEPDGTLVCQTLEDCDRDLDPNTDWKAVKVYGETAIPYGFYELKMQHSPHFGKMMPYVTGVVTHSGVMLHSGNKPADSLGCILVGKRVSDDVISNSKVTFNDVLIPVLAKYFKSGEPIYIQINKSEKVIDKRKSK